jgi:hypothetical protein
MKLASAEHGVIVAEAPGASLPKQPAPLRLNPQHF